jgi:hypothetical protein
VKTRKNGFNKYKHPANSLNILWFLSGCKNGERIIWDGQK